MALQNIWSYSSLTRRWPTRARDPPVLCMGCAASGTNPFTPTPLRSFRLWIQRPRWLETN